VTLTAPPARTKDATQSLAGTSGNANVDKPVTVKNRMRTATTDAPDREFTAAVNASGNWTLPSAAYDTTSSTPTTKDDALSGDDSYSIKVSHVFDTNTAPTTDSTLSLHDALPISVTLTAPPARTKDATQSLAG